MGRGLSGLQRSILRLGLNGLVFRNELVVRLVGGRPWRAPEGATLAEIIDYIRHHPQFGLVERGPRAEYVSALSSLSRALTRLEQRGFLERVWEHVYENGYGPAIRLTPAGVEAARGLSDDEVPARAQHQPIAPNGRRRGGTAPPSTDSAEANGRRSGQLASPSTDSAGVVRGRVVDGGDS